MSKISCNTITDLLPLYIDEVVSEDTRALVAEHLAQCPQCRGRYGSMTDEMTIPVERDISSLKRFKKAWAREKMWIAIVSVLVTIIMTAAGMMVYQNVSVVHDFFTPVTLVIEREANSSGDWKRLEVGETGYLNFDSIFYSKEVVLDADSDAEVLLRIRDQQGGIVLDGLTLQPGTGMPLDSLKSNQNYIVEIKTAGNCAIIRFL